MRTEAGSLLLVAVALLSGCLTSSQPSGRDLKVGSSGGTITAQDGIVKLVFPEGAVLEETQISVKAASSYPVSDAVIKGAVFEFGPSGIRFLEPVQLTIRYDRSNVPSGIEEESLGLAEAVGDEWEALPGSTVNTTEMTVTGPVSGFSTYAVLGLGGSVRLSSKSLTCAVGSSVLLTGEFPAREGEVYWCYWETSGDHGVMLEARHYPEVSLPPGQYEKKYTEKCQLAGEGTFSSSIHYKANDNAKENDKDWVKFSVYRQETGKEVLVGSVQATVKVSGIGVRIDPSPVQVDVRTSGRALLRLDILGYRTDGSEIIEWTTTGEHGHLDVWARGYQASYTPNEDVLDGQTDSLWVAVYRMEGSEKVLLGHASTLVDIYYPTRVYSLCGDPLGLTEPGLGSGSSWSFAVVGHLGILGGSTYARPSDKIRIVCHHKGSNTGDIYIRVGEVGLPTTKTKLLLAASAIVEGREYIVDIEIA